MRQCQETLPLTDAGVFPTETHRPKARGTHSSCQRAEVKEVEMRAADAWQMSGSNSCVKCDLVGLRHSKSSNQNQSLHARCIWKITCCYSLLIDKGHESFVCEEHFDFKNLFKKDSHIIGHFETHFCNHASDIFAKRRGPSRWVPRSCWRRATNYQSILPATSLVWRASCPSSKQIHLKRNREGRQPRQRPK